MWSWNGLARTTRHGGSWNRQSVVSAFVHDRSLGQTIPHLIARYACQVGDGLEMSRCDRRVRSVAERGSDNSGLFGW